MSTIELPRETWVDRLNAFTMAHGGWIASLEVFGAESGEPPAVVTFPLIGVSADRVDRDGTVAISVALSAGPHLTRVIHDVARICIEQSDDGARRLCSSKQPTAPERPSLSGQRRCAPSHRASLIHRPARVTPSRDGERA